MRRTLLTLTAAAATLTLAACGGGGSGPLDNGPSAGAPAPGDTIKIGSANFSESTLLATIYADALQAKGVKVDQTPPLGSRETYIPALKDGSIDLIPEYTGTLLQYLNPQATESSADEVYAALKKTVPAPLTVLDRSAAEDKDAVVVSKAVADRYKAKTIADLAPHCGELVFGGPSEFETRPDGIPGIKKTYNCAFKSYLSLDTGPVTVKAVTDNTVQAADIFTTNPAIEENNLVALEDPKNNFAAQNVVPLINSAKASDQVKQILNAISAKLTTAALVDLNRQLNAPDKPDSSTVAKAWLSQNGLG
ncbi:ABC transporter substrate-binding protein [Pseudonocardia sp. Cha107L01]|jgi:osmoprotectant transport system substrate-binding protein|uniref:ABC transporter substrate-binding protein n=1 Tax=Pseudonocardia sp. Cha107L01 TaxID=3457576 RepID=UPI0028C7E390|nr:osmoprotectant transport system substrate-binding protein [Pseudonocardiales bacterium]